MDRKRRVTVSTATQKASGLLTGSSGASEFVTFVFASFLAGSNVCLNCKLSMVKKLCKLFAVQIDFELVFFLLPTFVV